ncbi:MAG: hypothetical protein Pg6B_03910 [Candidatus Azobacteroides pseudotrichonymphae]|jgi:hypothetical protein|nr:MAG: hypothetical protein Pg6B_03910 [Candidatus Azobacteroides pseudotrichonymphae]
MFYGGRLTRMKKHHKKLIVLILSLVVMIYILKYKCSRFHRKIVLGYVIISRNS